MPQVDILQFTRSADERPYAAIVWSGAGTVNGCEAICMVTMSLT